MCSSLTSVTIGNSVKNIGNFVFYLCSSLTSVTIGNSVTSIGKSAFGWCEVLFSVSIPNSVEIIGDDAFCGCRGINSITIPNSIMSIGDGAFVYCSGLTEIRSLISEPFAINSNCWDGVNKEIPLYVPAGTKEKYMTTEGWNYFKNIEEIGTEPQDPYTRNIEFADQTVKSLVAPH